MKGTEQGGHEEKGETVLNSVNKYTHSSFMGFLSMCCALRLGAGGRNLVFHHVKYHLHLGGMFY